MKRIEVRQPVDRRIVVAFGLAALVLGTVGSISYRSTRHLIATES